VLIGKQEVAADLLDADANCEGSSPLDSEGPLDRYDRGAPTISYRYSATIPILPQQSSLEYRWASTRSMETLVITIQRSVRL
jgi:hypothetical protein